MDDIILDHPHQSEVKILKDEISYLKEENKKQLEEINQLKSIF